ncbi:MAG: alpha-amylase [Paramuribaculum sp.]|nr:alpha-amylase [Paramuribaculum sp.]
MSEKPIIYQLLPRLFANYNDACVHGGTLEQNGSGKLASINARILNSLHDMGITHMWYTGVIEHAHRPDYSAYGIPRHNPHFIKGEAGSPYAITDYYDIDPDLAVDPAKRMDEFEALIARTHRAGMKALIDFVPNHVAREYHSDAAPADAPADFGTDDRTDWFFFRDNNFYYLPYTTFQPHGVDLGEGDDRYIESPARASGNDCFTPTPGMYDWYDTVKLNYGVDYGNHTHHFDPIPSTWHKMLHILKYWAGKGVDGFRCDMVHMVPVEFWQWALPQVKSAYPGTLFIAEIYDINLYAPYINAGFDYLYDKVGLYDTLRGIECHGAPAHSITGSWQRIDGLQPHMLNFLENHDEQRFASAFYAGEPERVWASLVVSATISTGAVMIYAGQELGEPGADAEGYSGRDGRTTIFDYWSIDTLRRWLNRGYPANKNLTAAEVLLRVRYSRLLNICNQSQAIAHGGFFDLTYANPYSRDFDPAKQFAYLRHKDNELLLIAANFDNKPAHCNINIPMHAFEYIGITPGKRTGRELLTDIEIPLTLSPDSTVTLDIPAHGAVMVKMSVKI